MKSDWEIKWKKKVYETKEFPGDWEWGLSKWGINGIEQFIRKQIQQARQEGIEEAIGLVEGAKTGHSSYSCKNKVGICVCGASEDRWNLSLEEILSELKKEGTK